MGKRHVFGLTAVALVANTGCITIERELKQSGATLDYANAAPPPAGRTWQCEDGSRISLEPGDRPRLRVFGANLVVDNAIRHDGRTTFFHWQGNGYGTEYQAPDAPGPLRVRVHALWQWATIRLAPAGNFVVDGQSVRPASGLTAFATDVCAEQGGSISLYRGAQTIAGPPPGEGHEKVGFCIVTAPGADPSMHLSAEIREALAFKGGLVNWAQNPLLNDAFGGQSPLPLVVFEAGDGLVLVRRDGTGVKVTDKRRIGEVEGYYYERADTGFFIGRDGPQRVVYVFGPEALADDPANDGGGGALPAPRGPKAPGSYMTACLVNPPELNRGAR